MAKTTVATLEVRVNKIEESVNKQTAMLEQMMAMLTNGKTVSTKGKANPSTTKVDRDAQRQADKDAFKASHICIATSKQNKEKVYAEMKRQGITEFNRKDYERIAKGLGVLGKNGKVVSTWVENK